MEARVQMDRGGWQELVDKLRGVKVSCGQDAAGYVLYDRLEFDPGLSDPEVAAVEQRFGFKFPPDLREFLQTALPRGPRFPDWRSGDETELRDWLDTPRQGVVFDVQYNKFWLEEWGPRPGALTEALRIASDLVTAAPRLIPIYSNGMLPDEPHLAGNPVFSVHQTDIIVYGYDLADYLRTVFKLPDPATEPQEVRPIRFWDLDRFQQVRWGPDGSCAFDNSRGQLP
jgi:hypothetical protein